MCFCVCRIEKLCLFNDFPDNITQFLFKNMCVRVSAFHFRKEIYTNVRKERKMCTLVENRLVNQHW